jgi:Uma2 family endonuclease
MAEPALRIPSFDELYAQIEGLPQGVIGEILEPGVLRTMSRPGRSHGRAAKKLIRILGHVDVEDGGAGWWILLEPESRFPGPRLAVPDLAGYRVERVAELPEANPLSILPDWCCEILSPTTARDDRTLKLPLYARSGVGWTWLVDPALKTIEVYETVSGRPALAATARDNATLELPPFEGSIELTGLWIPSESQAAPAPESP